MNGNNRIFWVDFSKAILIVLVIFAHCPFVPPLLDTLICGFHMPAFFIISGYLHKYAPDMITCFKKNAKRLLVPALLFSILCYVIWLTKYLLLHKSFLMDECVKKPLLGLFIYDNGMATPMCGVIWFLVVLFMCFLLLDFIYMHFGKTGIISATLLCIMASIVFFRFDYKDFQYGFYLQRAIISFPFVAFGALLRGTSIRRQKALLPKSLALTVAYIVLVSINGRTGIYSCTFGQSVLTYYAASITGSLALFHWMAIFKHAPSFIVKISSGTIVILCLHQTMIPVFTHVWVNPYFITAMTAILCYLAISLFDRYLPWFVGKFH